MPMYASGVFARSSTLFQEAFNRWSQHNAPRLGAAFGVLHTVFVSTTARHLRHVVGGRVGANVANTEITTQIPLVDGRQCG